MKLLDRMYYLKFCKSPYIASLRHGGMLSDKPDIKYYYTVNKNCPGRSGGIPRKLLFFIFLNLPVLITGISGKDFFITGSVTDNSGYKVSGATILMTSGKMQFKAVSGPDGYYSMKVHGIYSSIRGQIEQGTPYPNPFTASVRIPFIVNSSGDLRFSVYTLSGLKVTDRIFKSLDPGSYNLCWDGRYNSGAPAVKGFYIYTLEFNDEICSGRLIKSFPDAASSSGSSVEPVMAMPVSDDRPAEIRISVITSINREGFFPVRLTDIEIGCDTTVDFTLTPTNSIPFKTGGDHIERWINDEYRPMILKGINLGSSPPGTFPGEIAYAISPGNYETWINRIGQAGFNCIRVYTLHPPVFYEKLADYNYRHPDDPILLFQGIWLDEVENPSEDDLFLRKDSFLSGIREVIDCIHGNRNISFRHGRSYGNYVTDVSQWTAGFITGREISPHEIVNTDRLNPSITSYKGYQLSISDGSASEVFATLAMDEVMKYEDNSYSMSHPVSFSSWPTLDPLTHPTEIYTDEDIASIDITRISGIKESPGVFATYHAYPYYPNFISQQPSYQTYVDEKGVNSYLGYLNDLKNHYHEIPLIIGEFGVPSSWGSAHWSYSDMEHGGYSEIQQGEKNIRMMHNILDAGCAGGFMFSWMDEWFKPTWIVQYLEAFGFDPGTGIVPTRQLWHNLASPEQNFGLLGFEQKETLPFIKYQTGNDNGIINRIAATNDNEFFMAEIELRESIVHGDTIMVAFDTYSALKGESQLPGGKELAGRSEFLLILIAGRDSAIYYVTEAYDMNGLTPRFNLSDPEVQKFTSIITDGSGWKPVEWINDGYMKTVSDLSHLPVENSRVFSPGHRTAVAWWGSEIRIRIPWTLLYFYDPTQMLVIDGAMSEDGRNYSILSQKSDGIALSVLAGGRVVSGTTRYIWDPWLVAPATVPREKRSLHRVEAELLLIPDFAN